MDEIKDMIQDESLATLLRSNLSCYLGKTMTLDSLDQITTQIVESIVYSIGKTGDKIVD
jgi:hypothetical protein